MFRSFLATLAIVGTGALHIAWTSVMPYPLNTVHITMIVLVYLLLTKRTILAIATACSVGFIIELYAVTPFGLLLGSLLGALLVGAFLAFRAITTISLGGATALTFIMVVVSRIAFWILFGFVALANPAITLSLVSIIESIFVEGLTTTIVATLLFALLPLAHRQPTVRVEKPYASRS